MNTYWYVGLSSSTVVKETRDKCDNKVESSGGGSGGGSGGSGGGSGGMKMKSYITIEGTNERALYLLKRQLGGAPTVWSKTMPGILNPIAKR